MMMKFNYAFLIVVVFALIACQDSKPKAKSVAPEKIENTFGVSSVQLATVHPGKRVYDQYCKVCHQVNGQGVSGIFPPLTPNQFVEDKAKMIDIVVNGMKGEIEIDGETYNGLMVPHSQLTNQQIADVISYVRTNFGNDLEAVSPGEVEAARK